MTLQQPKPKPPKHRDSSLPARKVEGQEQASSATRSRKPQINSDDDNEPELKRARLTRKNWSLFNKMGRKKGTKASASAAPESMDGASTTKTTSTTTSGFAIQAYENGILNRISSKPPTNLNDKRKQVTRSRVTASPPESVYKRYVDRVGGAVNEATMVVEVSKRLLKDYDDPGYRAAFNQAFTRFPKDVGFNNGLSAPQPDFVEGTHSNARLPPIPCPQASRRGRPLQG